MNTTGIKQMPHKALIHDPEQGANLSLKKNRLSIVSLDHDLWRPSMARHNWLILIVSLLIPGIGSSANMSLPSSPPENRATAVQPRLDMGMIFPTGPGRDLVLNNCLSCHGIVRIVTMQRTQNQWQYVKRIMRPRVSPLSDADANSLFAYLAAHFNDAKPVPPLPAWFLDMSPW